MTNTIQINQDRLWTTLMELGNIGLNSDPSNGVSRLSLSKEDLEGREYLIRLMKKDGLEVRVDEIGNIIGKYQGMDRKAPSVLTGSHIDTVFQGGKFDGALGVLGALEAVRTIKESGITLSHSIEIISFTDEEGTRFGTGYIGSRGFIGELDEKDLQLTDESGLTYKEALRNGNLNPENYKKAAIKPDQIKAFVEMHIEQGRVLEDNNLGVGIVTSIQGPVWLEVELDGTTDHAGATPMNIRRDASLGMAELMLEVEKIAKQYQGVGTVGKVKVEPGGVNVVPGKAIFSIDLRHGDKEQRNAMVARIYHTVQEVKVRRGLKGEIRVKKEVDPAACSEEIVQVLDEVCKERNIPTMKLACGAGHDSLILSKITKMGMIFVRSKNGISHHPREWTSKEDCVRGTEVLLHTLLRLAR
ncbi:Zn-dependent hydrolase [Evansella tamaricis]|uniref:Zn-dependent hydrolase n=1 Tax=Evansella tamaricis TaxID=2069301 RepID=A0ABS6JJP9_9BACI|nr:Zn-dependent hydrolase [Evansella tamaricis]MBU9713909.1 Zn-dependent hydrolase [Evansella tamaricis]